VRNQKTRNCYWKIRGKVAPHGVGRLWSRERTDQWEEGKRAADGGVLYFCFIGSCHWPTEYIIAPTGVDRRILFSSCWPVTGGTSVAFEVKACVSILSDAERGEEEEEAEEEDDYDDDDDDHYDGTNVVLGTKYIRWILNRIAHGCEQLQLMFCCRGFGHA
jgi:hypothetical protein